MILLELTPGIGSTEAQLMTTCWTLKHVPLSHINLQCKYPLARQSDSSVLQHKYTKLVCDPIDTDFTQGLGH